MRPTLARLLATVGAACLLVAPLPVLINSAQAAVPLATVPVLCADSVSGLTVFVDEVVSFGAVPAGCTVVSNSSTGNLDRVSSSGFVAFAVGSGAVLQLMTDGTQQYLVKVDVTILERSTPTPTPTSTQTAAPSPEASASSSETTTAPTPSSAPDVAGPQITPTAATPSEPRRWQELQRREIFAQPGADPGSIVVLSENGNPLQLLSANGPDGALEVTSQGTNFARPENWQFLQYGDLCWGYRGFQGAQALVLPVVEPPFRTLAAQWVFRSAIVGTPTGNVTVLDPAPGDIVEAGGREITTLTLCANGTPAEPDARSAPLKQGGGGGGYGTGFGWVPGCKNAGPQERNPHCHPGLEGPFTIVEPTTSSTSTPSAGTPSGTPSSTPSSSTGTSTTTTDDRPITFCRATQDASRPYVIDRALISELPVSYNRPYPMDGWTSIIPPRSDFAGQNWPEGQDTLYAKRCVVAPYVPPTQVVATPTPTASATATPTLIASPTPDPQLTPTPMATPTPVPTLTPTPLPQPTITATPEPQPTLSGYGPVQQWPPLYPIPVPLSLVTTPYATPTPYPTPTPTGSPSTPSPYATPTLSPYATPTPYPTPYPTPVATPYLVPTLITPTRAPEPAKDPNIAVPAVTASPTATPTVPDRPTATSTPTATPTSSATASPTATPSLASSAPTTATPTPSPTTATSTESPTATPSVTLTESATASPTVAASTDAASPPASANPPGSAGPSPESSMPTDVGGEAMVTLVLTNGPDTITVVRPYAVLVNKATSGGGSMPDRPSGEQDLANTGSTWTTAGTLALVLLGIAFLLVPRIARREERP